MALIFAVLFFVFIIFPLGKALWRGYQLHRSWKRATEGFRNAFTGATQRNASAEPKRKRKKIDPSVGEYVAFEEISVSATETSGDGTTTSYTYTESQIEDAVWEEIKE